MRRTWSTPICLALGALLSIGGLALVTDLAAAGPAQASGILPPDNPSADRSVDSVDVAACEQAAANASSSCESEALTQIDDARADEGVGPMTLPSDYLSLTPAEQLLVVIALERSARGLTVPAGLVASYDQDAAQGADDAADPAAPPGYANYGSIEAEGVYSVLLTDYEWMYDDGYGSGNAQCTSPSSSECWVHRDIILGTYSVGQYFYMGAAAGAGGAPVYTAVLGSSNQSQTVIDAYQPSAATTATKLPLTRLAGANRDLTSIAISQNSFPDGGSAQAVVLVTDADFPDALAGAPLAAAKDAPVLLTTPTTLDPQVATEIQRVLPKGRTVYILGGTGAVAQAITSQVQALGDTVVREAGSNRFATALAVAGALGDPSTVFVADGTEFGDALVAGPAATKVHGAIVLSNGTSMPGDTAAYLNAHPGSHYAVGAAAQTADPAAGVVGSNSDYATSAAVAQEFFGSTKLAGFASGATYPDELSGDAHIGAMGGPMILVPATGALPTSISSYLASSAVTKGYLYGGTSAVSSGVQAELAGS